jgi:hypothetical protein
MILSRLVQGLQIFQKYYDKDGYNIGAEHDTFYAYTTDRPLSEEDLKTVVVLGWFQQDVETADEGEFKPSDYDPAEGWSALI